MSLPGRGRVQADFRIRGPHRGRVQKFFNTGAGAGPGMTKFTSIGAGVEFMEKYRVLILPCSSSERSEFRASILAASYVSSGRRVKRVRLDSLVFLQLVMNAIISRYYRHTLKRHNLHSNITNQGYNYVEKNTSHMHKKRLHC